MTEIADKSDSGMATAEINAVFRLNRKRYRIEITKKAPIIISILKPFIEASIKLEGLNKSGIISIFWSLSKGSISVRALSSS